MARFALFVIIVPLFMLFLGSLRLLAQELVWNEEGVIFSDPTIHNVEVIPLPDGRYRMYFAKQIATEQSEDSTSKPNAIYSAISTDARNFQIESGVRLTGSMPAIVKLPDGKWRMYFASPSGETSSAEGGASFDEAPSYLQPIYVFSGLASTTEGKEGKFTAYIQAVSDEWVLK